MLSFIGIHSNTDIQFERNPPDIHDQRQWNYHTGLASNWSRNGIAGIVAEPSSIRHHWRFTLARRIFTPWAVQSPFCKRSLLAYIELALYHLAKLSIQCKTGCEAISIFECVSLRCSFANRLAWR